MFIAASPSRSTPSNLFLGPCHLIEGVIAVSQKPEATAPGIVVLSPSLQVLHMNRQAMVLLNQLEPAGQSVGAERTVAAPLHKHCQEIIETLKARVKSNNWEQFQQYRMIGGSTNTILLKGFGLPDQRGLSYSRIVVLLSPHNQAPTPEMRKEVLEMAGAEQQAGTTHDMTVPQPPIQGWSISTA
jgi:hypothetical protein